MSDSGAAPVRVYTLGSSAGGVITGVTSGTGIPVHARPHTSITFYLASQGTTSGGTVILEEADWANDSEKQYEGTWSQIASIAASTFTGTAQLAYHLSPNAYGAVRARISSAITGGGTITVTVRMN